VKGNFFAYTKKSGINMRRIKRMLVQFYLG
jgi:hypothetical protein